VAVSGLKPAGGIAAGMPVGRAQFVQIDSAGAWLNRETRGDCAHASPARANPAMAPAHAAA